MEKQKFVYDVDLTGKVIERVKPRNFNVVFKEEWKDSLNEWGFKKVKSKYPYYVRMMGEEIVQIITYGMVGEFYPYREFCIYGGVSTLYAKKIDFGENPKLDKPRFIENINVYEHNHNCYGLDLKRKETLYETNTYVYNSIYEEEMINAIKRSLEATRQNIIPLFNEIDTLEKCIQFYWEYNPKVLHIYPKGELNNIWNYQEYDYGEASLIFNIYDFDKYSIMRRKMQNIWEEKNFKDVEYLRSIGRSDTTDEEIKEMNMRYRKEMEKEIERVREFFENPEIRKEFEEEAERRKINNRKILRELKLIK